MKAAGIRFMVAVGLLAGLPCLRADFAPAQLTNEFFTVNVTGGMAPFATNGSYLLFTSATGTNYTILGNAGAGLGSGSYGYAKTGSSGGLFSLSNASPSAVISGVLTFTSASVRHFDAYQRGGDPGGGIFRLKLRLRHPGAASALSGQFHQPAVSSLFERAPGP